MMFRFKRFARLNGYIIFTVGLCLIIFACSVQKEIPISEGIDETYLDTLVITPGDPIQNGQLNSSEYKGSATRNFDLIHTKLDIKFSWNAQTVIGKAWLILTPYMYPQTELELDAIGFYFDSIGLSGYFQPVETKYDNRKLSIKLPNKLSREDTIEVFLSYVAFPQPKNGSAEQGLFFINPVNEKSGKPCQIWTQGQPEYNSYWFPTIDKPNERCTQEISITVENEFITISNGVLISSDHHTNGTRTDHWRLEIPHPPYLCMITVGNFAVFEEVWNGKKIGYYVDPDYGPFAKHIFDNTVEMLEYFSVLFDYPFPWPKYDQIVVHDFLAGAMENTTAVLYNNYVQKDLRELKGNKNDYIISHELVHHWFGNLVTCENWANLTLNEGFADYGTYLWEDHKFGRDAGEYYLWQEWQGYIFETLDEIHPLIHFYYEDEEDMFDSHSYNKGCLVLHMLRKYIGDGAFFSGIQTYLKKFQFTSTEIHDLRLTFEEVTGTDLNWFFDQWFFSPGHPVIDFSYTWNSLNHSLEVMISQEQDPIRSRPVFTIPTSLTLFWKDSVQHIPIEINRRNQILYIDCHKEPELAVIDESRDLLAVIKQDFSVSQLHRLYNSSQGLRARHMVVSNLRDATDATSDSVKFEALSDPFWLVRMTALNGIDWIENPEYWNLLCNIVAHDPHPAVRINSIEILGEMGHADHFSVIASLINQQEPYSVVSSAIENCFRIDSLRTMNLVGSIDHENYPEIVLAVAYIYSYSNDLRYASYFNKKLKVLNDNSLEPFLEYAFLYFKNIDNSFLFDFIKTGQQLIVNQEKSIAFRKILGSSIIDLFHVVPDREFKDSLEKLIFQMIEFERDPSLKSFFVQLIN